MTAGPTTTFTFDNIDCEFVAIILAATVGARLFPLTTVAPFSSTTSNNNNTDTTSSTTKGTSVASPTVAYKHLLPLGGQSILSRLIQSLHTAGFCECVLVLAAEDTVTMPTLRAELADGWTKDLTTKDTTKKDNDDNNNKPIQVYLYQRRDGMNTTTSSKLSRARTILRTRIIRLDESTAGSAGALRQVERSVLQAHPQFRRSHCVVLPGDACVLSSRTLPHLVQSHRRGQGNGGTKRAPLSTETGPSSSTRTACTVLLTNVLECDEHGEPLKESAKQKKGGLAREDEEMEYLALLYSGGRNNNNDNAPRIVWKQPKVDVEEDRDLVGTSPKWIFNKSRLRSLSLSASFTRVGLHWNDVHVYVLSPWVRKLVLLRTKLVSLQSDLLPLLITRQFLSVMDTFGRNLTNNNNNLTGVTHLQLHPKEIMEELGFSVDGDTEDSAGRANAILHVEEVNRNDEHDLSSVPLSPLVDDVTSPYDVAAVIPPQAYAVLRAQSIPAYLHANKELANIVCQQPQPPDDVYDLAVPSNTVIHRKLGSLLLPGTVTGSKVNFKSAVVGRSCTLGNKCRLNNVVIMDHVTIGDNVVLQNSIIGAGCTIGENSNLNDCQVCKDISAGSKEKSESFAVGS